LKSILFSLEVLRLVAVFVGTGLAALEDARTSFIDDRITLSMITLGVALDVFFLPQEFWLQTALFALAISVLGFLAYRAGQFGGGDVLLILGIHLLLPLQTQPVFANALAANALAFASQDSFFSQPFFFPPIVSILAIASLAAVIASSAWYAFRLRQEKGFQKNKTLAFASVCVIVATTLAFSPFSLVQKTFFILLASSAFFHAFFKRELMERVVVKKLRLRDVEEEDVLFLEGLPQSLVKRFGIQRVLTESEVEKLRLVEKKTGRRFWPVCKELPRFAPFLFLGLFFFLAFGDFVLFLLLS